MKNNQLVQQAIEIVNELDQELLEIVKSARSADVNIAGEALKRWKSRAVRKISERINPSEGTALESKRKMTFTMGEPLLNLEEEADMYFAFLKSLRQDIERHPEDFLTTSGPVEAATLAVEVPQPPSSIAVFIVHGHDELNLLRLEKILREQWHLEPVILKYKAGEGRTIIEKFEEEAQRATYAIVLLTPDDLITASDGSYAQARPNVIFELGWFYGRLTRKRVCILYKKGTTIHTDLEGIARIQFDDTVEEAVTPLREELKTAGLLKASG